MIPTLVACILKSLHHNLMVRLTPFIDLIIGDIHTTAFESVISVMMQLLNGQKLESSLAACCYSLPAVLICFPMNETATRKVLYIAYKIAQKYE